MRPKPAEQRRHQKRPRSASCASKRPSRQSLADSFHADILPTGMTKPKTSECSFEQWCLALNADSELGPPLPVRTVSGHDCATRSACIPSHACATTSAEIFPCLARPCKAATATSECQLHFPTHPRTGSMSPPLRRGKSRTSQAVSTFGHVASNPKQCKLSWKNGTHTHTLFQRMVQHGAAGKGASITGRKSHQAKNI